MSEIGKVEIAVQAKVNPTEDPAKVQTAIRKVLGPIQLETRDDVNGAYLQGLAEGLEQLTFFQELLRKERIRDAARRVLLRGIAGDTVTFFLNKQVAYAGHVSFCQPEGESPLGPIRVEVKCSNSRKLAEWLAPKTAKLQENQQR